MTTATHTRDPIPTTNSQMPQSDGHYQPSTLGLEEHNNNGHDEPDAPELEGTNNNNGRGQLESLGNRSFVHRGSAASGAPHKMDVQGVSHGMDTQDISPRSLSNASSGDLFKQHSR